jgi:hypothetical protein
MRRCRKRATSACAARPAWRYPGEPFEALGGISRVDGDWLACERCHSLIEARRFLALCDESVKRFVKKFPASRRDKTFVRRIVADMHNAFRAHRRGEPFRIDH